MLATNPICPNSMAFMDTASAPEAIAASDLGGGTIHVLHTGYPASCCLSFSASATLTGDQISATYTPIGDPCDCGCPYTIEYDVNGIPAGTYTLSAGEVNTSVDVL